MSASNPVGDSPVGSNDARRTLATEPAIVAELVALLAHADDPDRADLLDDLSSADVARILAEALAAIKDRCPTCGRTRTPPCLYGRAL
jgi:hypothetical protein